MAPRPILSPQPYPSMKPCSKCRRRLPLENFGAMGGRRQTLRADCKECYRKAKREAYAKLKRKSPSLALRREPVTDGQRKAVKRSRLEKVCSRCKERKPLKSFRAKTRGKFGVAAKCKLCEYEWLKVYRVTLRS
jgi:ribosomal protein L44E